MEKYKAHLKQIWDYMLKDKVKYGVSENEEFTTEDTHILLCFYTE